MTVRIDLHTHSDRSDGTCTPRELVRAASEAGLDVVALTDHDTAEGWAEATVTAEARGVALVPGMEISCTLEGKAVHLLGYLLDPAYPPLHDALTAILAGRDERMPHICERLRHLGIPIAEADVVAGAGSATALGRPHVADALVARGVVESRDEAFDRFLSPGRPAYVRRYAPPVEEMIGLVREAGGVSVLAHPWGRGAMPSLGEEGIERLADLGLAGLEVDHEDHTQTVRVALRGIAGRLDLLVTGSSDFHGTGKVGHGLGCNTTAAEQYERLLALAGEAERAAGRRTPAVSDPRATG